MSGIRTYFRKWSESESGFQQAYRCLYPLLGGLYLWVRDPITDAQFHWPWDDDKPFQEFINELNRDENGGGQCDVHTLIKNDQYVTDDWNALVLTDVADPKANRTLSNHVVSAVVSPAACREHRIVIFQNVDGVFWQFFTNDQRLIDRMLHVQCDNADLDLRLVNYSKHYPSPGGYDDCLPIS